MFYKRPGGRASGARRTFETREQRAVTITLWFRWGCRGAGRIADEVVPAQWESMHDQARVRLTTGGQIFVVCLVLAVCQPWPRMKLRRRWFLRGPIFAVSVCDSMMTERFSVYSEPVALSVGVHNARTCEVRLATPLLSCRSGLASWCKSDWQDDDLFKLTPPELDVLKLRVAVCIKARYKGNVNGDYGLEVGGMKPLDPEASEPQLRERSGKVKEVHSIPS